MEKLPTCVQGLINTMDKAIILRHRVEPGLYALVALQCHQYSSKWRSHQVVSQQAIDQDNSLG